MKKSPMDFAIGDRCCFEVLCAMCPHLAPDSRCQLFRLMKQLWLVGNGNSKLIFWVKNIMEDPVILPWYIRENGMDQISRR